MTMAATSRSGEQAPITVLPPDFAPNAADEVNHRVANSLQLLSAMVAMEARAIEDPAALAALDMTRRRITAIAGVHRQLYRARTTATVDLAAYLAALGEDLEGSVDAGREVRVEAAPFELPSADATAIGIIVSELVTNACKYAYAPGEPGAVRVSLMPAPLGGYALQVEDRGRGMATGRAPQGTGLGGMLVEMMAKRLGGRCAYHDAAPGTRFVLTVARR